MRITKATTYIVGNPWKNWLFVRLDTDQPGLYGIGEGTLNGLRQIDRSGDPRAGAPVREAGPVPDRDDLPAHDARHVLRWRPDSHGNAVAAIEIACWDIIGKVTGRPIYDLLGGRYHESLPAYANGWYAGPRTPESFAESRQPSSSAGATRR